MLISAWGDAPQLVYPEVCLRKFTSAALGVTLTLSASAAWAQPVVSPQSEPSLMMPRMPMSFPPTIKARIDPAKHTLAPGDVLEFLLDMHKSTVKGADVPHTYAVRADGMVELAIAGEVKVAGLKLAQVEKILSDKLKKKLRNPKFRLGLASAAPVQIVVLGEVKLPGRYDIAPGSGIQEAIAVAGGYSALADKNSILVQDAHSGNTTVATKPTAPGGEQPLRNGDVVYVLAGKKINVLGEVFAPGQYALPSERPYAPEALSAAGGAKPTAALARCVIFRPGTTESFPIRLGGGTAFPIPATVTNTTGVGNATLPATASNGTAPVAMATPAAPESVKMIEGDILIVPPRQAVVINQAPKAVPLLGGENIMDIITQGGITPQANLEDVRVVRNGGDAVEHINVKKYLETQDRSVLVPIHDGDIVVVDNPGQGGGFFSNMAAALLNPFTLLNLFTR